MIRDPGLPQDPDHEAFRDLDHYGRVRDEPSPPGDGVAPIGSPLPHEVVYPALREYPDVPILDWCYAYPLSLGRAAPGARRVRWNGQIVTGEPGDDGPGALWTHPGTAHLRPVSAPPVRSQSGISRMGIRRAGGVTAAGIVVVPRTSLLEVAEYADATLNWSGAEGDLPTRGLGEWSLAIGGGPAGVWFGIRTVSFGGPRQGIADRRRFAEVVGAEWIIEVGGIDHDGAAVHDRLRVCTFDAYEVYRWDNGETHLVNPSAIEPSLDPARRRITVDRQVIETRSSLKLTLPKGRRRRVTMYPAATPGGINLAVLVERRLAEIAPDDLVFPAPMGGWARRSDYGRNTWDPAATSMDWPRKSDGRWAWTFHSPRHVFATWALNQPGLRLEDVARLLGHSSTRVTQDIYIHVADDLSDRFYAATEPNGDLRPV